MLWYPILFLVLFLLSSFVQCFSLCPLSFFPRTAMLPYFETLTLYQDTQALESPSAPIPPPLLSSSSGPSGTVKDTDRDGGYLGGADLLELASSSENEKSGKMGSASENTDTERNGKDGRVTDNTGLEGRKSSQGEERKSAIPETE